MSQILHYSPVTKNLERCTSNCKYGDNAVTTDSDGNEFRVLQSRPDEKPTEFFHRVEQYEELAALERGESVYGTVTSTPEPEPMKTLADFHDEKDPPGQYARYQNDLLEHKISTAHPDFEFRGGRNRALLRYEYDGEIGNYQEGYYKTGVVYDYDTGEFQSGYISLDVQEEEYSPHYRAGDAYYSEAEYEKALYYNNLITDRPASMEDDEYGETDEYDRTPADYDLRNNLEDVWGRQ